MYIFYNLHMHLELLKKPAFFTIQLIFDTIHKSHFSFWYYSWPRFTIQLLFSFIYSTFNKKFLILTK